jgi:hypothetical protein
VSFARSEGVYTTRAELLNATGSRLAYEPEILSAAVLRFISFVLYASSSALQDLVAFGNGLGVRDGRVKFQHLILQANKIFASGKYASDTE